MDKLRVDWGTRVRRYEEKVKKEDVRGIAKLWGKEKEEYRWKDGYGKEWMGNITIGMDGE